MPPKPDEARRAALIKQLRELVLAEGFAHLRVGTIAQRLHCSRSTLYKLADSKDALIALLVQDYIDEALSDAAALSESMSSPVDGVLAYVNTIRKWQGKASVAFWRDVHDDPATDALLTAASHRGIAIIKSRIDEGIERGEIRDLNSGFVAHWIWLGSNASRDPEVLARFDITSAEAIEELRAMLAGGLPN